MKTVKILIIDDTPAIHEDFKRIFTHTKQNNDELDRLEEELLHTDREKFSCPYIFELEHAFQGQEGLAKVESAYRANTPFQIAFIDMRMPPGWDGLKTLNEILKNDPSIQTVICTAYSDYELQEIVQVTGICDRLLILKKPFEQIEILQIALAMSEKYFSTQLANLKMNELEKLVHERSEALITSSKMVALGEMASGMAHEINNPLTIISGYARILKAMGGNNNINLEEFRHHTSIIDGTVERIANIIKGLLTFASPITTTKRKPHDIKQIITQVLDLCLERIKSSNISLDYSQIDDNLLVHCDPSDLAQAFLNMINNAYDHVVQFNERWINISAHQTQNTIKIAISNSGTKIPDDVQQKMMIPFFTTKRPNEGLGLGLSNSYRVIKNLGGTLYYDKNHSHNRFTIELNAYHEN